MNGEKTIANEAMKVIAATYRGARCFVRIAHEGTDSRDDEVLNAANYSEAVLAASNAIDEDAERYGFDEAWKAEMQRTLLVSGAVDLKTGRIVSIEAK